MAPTVERSKGAKLVSVTVVEPLPMLMIRTAGKTGETDVLVDGMSGDTAVAMDWGPIIDFAIDLGKKIFGGNGGGGGGGKGCTTIKITNPDGSSTEIKQCPPA